NLNLGEQFDLINVANVLFHIPEPDRFGRALQNLAAHLAPDGRIVTTEYLPRTACRTNWMMVRSRYDFAAAIAAVGLRIVEIRASSSFSNDPMGIDAGNTGALTRFQNVRARMDSLAKAGTNPETHRFIVELFSEIERAALEFCAERVPEIEMPSQKLVVLG